MEQKIVFSILLITLMMAGSCGRSTDIAIYRYDDNVELRVKRIQKYELRNEYDRIGEIEISKQILPVQLLEDTGGYSRINIYNYYEGIILVDQFDSIWINLTNKTIIYKRLEDFMLNQLNKTYVGSFNDNGGLGWRFISKSKGKEMPFILQNK